MAAKITREYFLVSDINNASKFDSWGASMVATSSHRDIRQLVKTGANLRSMKWGDEWVVAVERLNHGNWENVGFINEFLVEYV